MRLVFVLHSMTQVCMEHVQCSIKLVLISNTESSTCGIFVCFGCVFTQYAGLSYHKILLSEYLCKHTLERNICSLNPLTFDYISARPFVSYVLL